mgnify:CR=1 FL=1
MLRIPADSADLGGFGEGSRFPSHHRLSGPSSRRGAFPVGSERRVRLILRGMGKGVPR